MSSSSLLGSSHDASDYSCGERVNPLQGVQQAIQNGWKGLLDNLLRLNPIPEALRPLFGSRYFWFALWIALFSAFGRNLFGERIGGWVGLLIGGALWAVTVPDSSLELVLLVILLIALPALGGWLTRSGLGRRARGVKVCPDCSEDVKAAAKVCKHCAYRFETAQPIS